MTERFGKDIPNSAPDFRALWETSSPHCPIRHSFQDTELIPRSDRFSVGCPGRGIVGIGRICDASMECEME